MGSKLSISTGDAFDVKVQPVVEKRERLSDSHWKTTMRYTLTNALPKAVTVRVIQRGLWGDTKVSAESRKGERLDADSVAWNVPVPANGKLDLSATFDSKY